MDKSQSSPHTVLIQRLGCQKNCRRNLRLPLECPWQELWNEPTHNTACPELWDPYSPWPRPQGHRAIRIWKLRTSYIMRFAALLMGILMAASDSSCNFFRVLTSWFEQCDHISNKHQFFCQDWRCISYDDCFCRFCIACHMRCPLCS